MQLWSNPMSQVLLPPVYWWGPNCLWTTGTSQSMSLFMVFLSISSKQINKPAERFTRWHPVTERHPQKQWQVAEFRTEPRLTIEPIHCCTSLSSHCPWSTYLRKGPRDSSSFLVNLRPPHDLLATLEQDQGRELFGEGWRAHFVPTRPERTLHITYITPRKSQLRPLPRLPHTVC